MAGAVCISEQTYKLIHRNNFVAETFEFKEHHPCEIGVIGKTIKSYKVDQIFNEVGESSEEYTEDGGDGDYDDREDRLDRSSRSGSDEDDSMDDGSRRSAYDGEEGKSDET